MFQISFFFERKISKVYSSPFYPTQSAQPKKEKITFCFKKMSHLNSVFKNSFQEMLCLHLQKAKNKKNVPWIGRVWSTHINKQSCHISSVVTQWCSGYHSRLVLREARVRILLGTRVSFQRYVSKATGKLFTSFLYRSWNKWTIINFFLAER